MTPTKVSQDSHTVVICYASTLKKKHILGEILQFNSQAPATHALSFLHTYLVSFSMKARSGQNHDNKIAPQVSFNPTAANIMDMCVFFS